MEVVMIVVAVAAIALGLTWTLWGSKGKKYAAKLIEDNVTDERFQIILQGLNRGAFTVITALQEEVVEDLKHAAADGKLTQEDIEDIAESAIERLKMTVPEASLDFLAEQMGMDWVDDLLGTIIESNLFNLKHGVSTGEQDLVKFGNNIIEKSEPLTKDIEKKINQITSEFNENEVKELQRVVKGAERTLNGLLKLKK